METLQKNLSAKAKDSRSGLWNKVEGAAQEASQCLRLQRHSCSTWVPEQGYI